MSEAAPKQQPMIDPGRVRLAEYDRNIWIANAEHGRTPQELLDPAYWSLKSAHFQPYDQIEARAEDGSWVAYYIVTDTSRTWARVVLDRIVKLTTGDVSLSQAQASVKHEVKWKGPQNKYSVIRIADSVDIQHGFKSAEAAHVWLREHERTTA